MSIITNMNTRFSLFYLHDGTFLVRGNYEQRFSQLPEAMRFIISHNPEQITIFPAHSSTDGHWTLERQRQVFPFSNS